MTAYDQYTSDPVFRNLVDMFRSLLENDGGRNFTPSDVRAAALLACSQTEYYRVRPITAHTKEKWARIED